MSLVRKTSNRKSNNMEIMSKHDHKEAHVLMNKVKSYEKLLDDIQNICSRTGSETQSVIENDENRELLQQISNSVSELRLNQVNITGVDAETMEKLLKEGFSESEDVLHKECVNVYRNMQSVVVGEANEIKKQTQIIADMQKSLKKMQIVTIIMSGVALLSIIGAAVLIVLC